MFKNTLKMALVAAASVAFLGGCGAEDAGDPSNARMFSTLGNDFTGNYVKIKGTRKVPADKKYPCLNSFEVCLSLDPEGITNAVKDLCPSDNTPEGTWNFTYVIYDDNACQRPLANLGCVPDLNEWLHPGQNSNNVTCITRNADKTFNFCVMDPITGAGSDKCPKCSSVADSSQLCAP
jgi:hypothetical protein